MKPESLAERFGITEFPFEIKNDKGDLVYREFSNGDISEWKYDDKGNIIWEKDTNGDIFEYKRDANGKLIWAKIPSGNIYTLNENGKWIKQSETL